jgi:hypothetical protein
MDVMGKSSTDGHGCVNRDTDVRRVEADIWCVGSKDDDMDIMAGQAWTGEKMWMWWATQGRWACRDEDTVGTGMRGCDEAALDKTHLITYPITYPSD